MAEPAPVQNSASFTWVKIQEFAEEVSERGLANIPLEEAKRMLAGVLSPEEVAELYEATG